MIEKQEKQTCINTILVKSKQSEKTKRMENQKEILIEENLPDLFNETNETIQTSVENKLI